MKVIETIVYDFDELSDDAKQKAIDNWYSSEEYPFLCDDILEFINGKDEYFSGVKLAYSLSYSQGDGLSFSGEFDFDKWIDDKYTYKQSVKRVLKEYVYRVLSKANRGHYSYCSRSDIDFELNTYKSYENIDLLVDEIISDIQDYYIDLCNSAEKYGYDEIEYRMTFDEFSEICESNGYTFTNDGKMKNY